MTTPAAPNSISMSQIIAEFGANSPSNGFPNQTKLGSYRISQRIAGRDWTLDEGIPSSGSISFSQLRAKTLNVVVDYGGSTEYGVNSQGRYDSEGVVVGGFRARPASNAASTKKVYHIIRKSIGGRKLVGSLTPTEPVQPERNRSFVAGVVRSYYGVDLTITANPNTLGVFVDKAQVPSSGGFVFGGRTYGGTSPKLGSISNVNTPSGNLEGTGGSVFSFNRNVNVTTEEETISVGGYFVKGQQISRTSKSYWNYTKTSYSYSLVERGNGTRGGGVSVTWPGVKSFSFTITSTAPGTAFSTGSTWNSATLYYIITSIGRIIGAGGDGGTKSYPNGEPGGHAFGAQVNCNLIIERGGVLAGGGGGGGRGGDYYYDHCGRCLGFCCGGWGCGTKSGGTGGSGAGLSPTSNRPNATAGGKQDNCGNINSGVQRGDGGNGGQYGKPGGNGLTPATGNNKQHDWNETRGSGSPGGSAGRATTRSSGVVINIDQQQGAIIEGDIN